MTSSTDFNDDRHELILKHLQGKLDETEQLLFLQQVEEDPSLKEELTFMRMLRVGGQGLGKQYLAEEKESIEQIKIPKPVPFFKRIPLAHVAKIAAIICFILINLGLINNLKQQQSISTYLDLQSKEKERLHRVIDSITTQQETLNLKLNLISDYWQTTLKTENECIVTENKNTDDIDHFVIHWGKKLYKIKSDYEEQKLLLKLYENKLNDLKSNIKYKDQIIKSYCFDIIEKDEELLKMNINLREYVTKEQYYLQEISMMSIGAAQ